MNKKHIKKYTFTLLLLCIFVLISTVSLYYNYQQQEKEIEEMSDNYEKEWRKECNKYLQGVKNQLEYSINDGTLNPYNDKDIKQWFISNMELLKITDNNIDDFRVICIGSTITNNTKKLHQLLLDYDINDKDLENNLNNKISNILNSVNENSISNADINTMIEEATNEIVEDTNLDYNKIKDILQKSLFSKNKLLFSINDSIKDNNYEELNYSYKNKQGDIIWVESLVIPEGALGFDSEPAVIDGKLNVNYKKIQISLAINSSSFMQTQTKCFNNYYSIFKLSSNLLICIIIVSIVVIVIIFKSALNLNKDGGTYDTIEDTRGTNNHNGV